MDELSEIEELNVLTKVYSLEYFVSNESAVLPKMVYKNSFNNIFSSFLRGYGVKYMSNSNRNLLFNNLNETNGSNTKNSNIIRKLPYFRENVNYFCMAKTAQHVEELQSIINKGRSKVSLDEFIAKGKEINRTYDVNYLESEYDTANAVGESAKWWDENNIQDNTLLTYITKDDSKVRFEHKLLDGIVKPAGDRFWTLNYPPNGDRCRCHVRKSFATEKPTDLKNHIGEFNKDNDTNFTGVYNNDVRFDFNPAKAKIVFSEKSSYFNTWDKYNLDFNNSYKIFQ